MHPAVVLTMHGPLSCRWFWAQPDSLDLPRGSASGCFFRYRASLPSWHNGCGVGHAHAQHHVQEAGTVGAAGAPNAHPAHATPGPSSTPTMTLTFYSRESNRGIERCSWLPLQVCVAKCLGRTPAKQHSLTVVGGVYCTCCSSCWRPPAERSSPAEASTWFWQLFCGEDWPYVVVHRHLSYCCPKQPSSTHRFEQRRCVSLTTIILIDAKQVT